MGQREIFDLLYLTLFTAVVTGILLVLFGVWRALRPAAPAQQKGVPYECGMDQMSTPWGRFHIRYYYFGLLFVLFDVETVLLFAVATRFRPLALEGAWQLPLATVTLFIVLVLGALVYAWSKGALEWK